MAGVRQLNPTDHPDENGGKSIANGWLFPQNMCFDSRSSRLMEWLATNDGCVLNKLLVTSAASPV